MYPFLTLMLFSVTSKSESPNDGQRDVESRLEGIRRMRASVREMREELKKIREEISDRYAESLNANMTSCITQ